MIKLEQHAKNQILQYPYLIEQIMDLLQLCCDEIEAGESRQNEIELCYWDIQELIEENG